MSVDNNEVLFYKSKNLQEDSYSFRVGDTIEFPADHPDNDRFRSCNVGRDVIVNVYESNDLVGQSNYSQLRGPGVDNNLQWLGGLSKFQVLSNAFVFAIDIRVVSKIPNDKSSYELTLEAVRSPPCKAISCNANYVQCPITAFDSGDQVICKVLVRQSDYPWSYISNGSIHFKYNMSTGVITHTTDRLSFPSNLSITQEGKTNFCFNIKSLK
eukprot:gene16944-20156_t